jgi:trans-aconitate methyltransferase
VSDVIAFSEIPDGGSVLDIGCGTGQATRPFLARGYSAVCIDIGAHLIARAKSALADFTQVEFVVSPFEEWQTDRTFHLLISATAFRWLDPTVRYLKAASLLSHGGCLAVFSHRHKNKGAGFFGAVQSVYRQHVPEWSQPASPTNLEPCGQPEPGFDEFGEPIVKRYPWSAAYSAEQYVHLLNTYSDHIALRPDQKEMLFCDIARMIDEEYSGEVTKEYETVLEMRRRKR